MTTLDHLLAIPAAPAGADTASQRRSDGSAFAGVLSDVEHPPGPPSPQVTTGHRGSSGSGADGESAVGEDASPRCSHSTAVDDPAVVARPTATTSVILAGASTNEASLVDPAAETADRATPAVEPLPSAVETLGRSFLAARLQSSVIGEPAQQRAAGTVDVMDPASAPVAVRADVATEPAPAAPVGSSGSAASTIAPAEAAAETPSFVVHEAGTEMPSVAASSPTAGTMSHGTVAAPSQPDVVADPLMRSDGPVADGRRGAPPAAEGNGPAVQAAATATDDTTTAPPPAESLGDRPPVPSVGGTAGQRVQAANSPLASALSTPHDTAGPIAADRGVATPATAPAAAGPRPSPDSVAAIAAVVGPPPVAGGATGSAPSAASPAAPTSSSSAETAATGPNAAAARATDPDSAAGGPAGRVALVIDRDRVAQPQNGAPAATPSTIARSGVDGAPAAGSGQLAPSGGTATGSTAISTPASAMPASAMPATSATSPSASAMPATSATSPAAVPVATGPGAADAASVPAEHAEPATIMTSAAPAPNSRAGAEPTIGVVRTVAHGDAAEAAQHSADVRTNRPTVPAGQDRPAAVDDLARPDVRPTEPAAPVLDSGRDARTVASTTRAVEHVAWREVLDRIDRHRLVTDGRLELEIVTERFGLLRVEAAEGRDGIHLSLRGDEASHRELADLADELRQQFGRDGGDVADVEVGDEEDASLHDDQQRVDDDSAGTDDPQLDPTVDPTVDPNAQPTTHPTGSTETAGGLDLRL